MEGVEGKRAVLLDDETRTLLKEQEEALREEERPTEEELVRHVHPAKALLFGSILVTLFIALVASVTSDSNVAYALLGFTPTLIAAILFIALLEGDYKDVLFWLAPLAICFLFFAVGTTAGLGRQLDIPVLTAVNMLLSYLIVGAMFLVEYRREPEATLEELEQFEPEHLDKYVHTIEEKCKALNFAIGRVYRASNGGTAEMRERLKVPSEWYNEFYDILKEEHRYEKMELEPIPAALVLLGKIRERLSVLLRPESEVFTRAELQGLKNVARDAEGKDRIIDVLSVNDSDPVEQYFLGAMDFCKKITERLQSL